MWVYCIWWYTLLWQQLLFWTARKQIILWSRSFSCGCCGGTAGCWVWGNNPADCCCGTAGHWVQGNKPADCCCGTAGCWVWGNNLAACCCGTAYCWVLWKQPGNILRPNLWSCSWSRRKQPSTLLSHNLWSCTWSRRKLLTYLLGLSLCHTCIMGANICTAISTWWHSEIRKFQLFHLLYFFSNQGWVIHNLWPFEYRTIVVPCIHSEHICQFFLQIYVAQLPWH